MSKITETNTRVKLDEQLKSIQDMRQSGIKLSSDQLQSLKQQIPNYIKYKKEIDTAFNAVYTGKKTPGQALKEVAGGKSRATSSNNKSIMKNWGSARHLYNLRVTASVGAPLYTRFKSEWMSSIYQNHEYEISRGELDVEKSFPDVLAFVLSLSAHLYGDDARTWQISALIDAMAMYYLEEKALFVNINGGLSLSAPQDLGKGWALPLRLAIGGGITTRRDQNSGIGGNFFGQLDILKWENVELFIRGGLMTQDGVGYHDAYYGSGNPIPKWKSTTVLKYALLGLRFYVGSHRGSKVIKRKPKLPPPVHLPLPPKPNPYQHLKDKLKPTYVQTPGDKWVKGNRNPITLSSAGKAKARSESAIIYPHAWAKQFGYVKFELKVEDVHHTLKRKNLVRYSSVHIVPADLKLPKDKDLTKQFVHGLVKQWAQKNNLSDPEKYYFSYIPSQMDSTVTAKLSPNINYKIVSEAGDNGKKRRGANRFDNFLVRTNVAHGGINVSKAPDDGPKEDRFKNTLVGRILKDWPRITPSTNINIMFVIDGSGSMEHWKEETRRAVARVISDLRGRGVRGNINVGLRTFGEAFSKPRTLLKFRVADSDGLKKLSKQLDEIKFFGAIERVGQAIETSLKMFRGKGKDLNYMFVLTDDDGLDERNEPGSISQSDAIDQAERQKVNVSVFVEADKRAEILGEDRIIDGMFCIKGMMVVIDKNGRLKSATLSRDITIQGIHLTKGTTPTFYKNGKLKFATLSRNQTIQKIPCAGGWRVYLYKNGRLGTVALSRNHTIQKVPCAAGGITFYSNGKLSSAWLSRDYTSPKGVRLREGGSVTFDQDGEPINYY